MKAIDLLEEIKLGLTIFDIDDTLFRTTAQIKVVKDGREIRSLNNQEFNTYQLQDGESFDFGEFRNAEKFNKESIPISPMIAKLKAIIKNAGASKVIMLTARADFDNKDLFLDTFRKYGVDMSKVHVHRAGNLGIAPAESKAVWIRKYLDTGKFGRVRLYDDAMSNIKMFINLQKEYPGVQFFPYFVTHKGGITTIREEVNIDNKSGRGHVTNNSEVDYFGMRVKMKPSTFIKLASKLGQEPSDEMIDYIKKGGAIASPFLIISTDGTDNPASVIGHEGRNRMLAVIKAEGDVPVEVHLFFNSNQVNRARHLTPELVGSLKQKLISQDDNIVNGPLWEDSRIVKGVNTTVDVGTDEIKTQAAKFGFNVDKDGRPPTLSKNVKGKSTNVLYNLGMTENSIPRYTAAEWAIIEGGHSLEIPEAKTKLFNFDKY